MQDGEDFESFPVGMLPRYAQLALVLAKIKQPKEGFTFPELALAFYGLQRDIKKMANMKPEDTEEFNSDLRKWTPSYPQGNRMKALAHDLRSRMIKRNADPNYCVKLPMQEFNGESVHIMIPIKTVDQFDHNIGMLRKKEEGYRSRANKLEILKKLPQRERTTNTKELLNEWKGKIFDGSS